MKKVLAILLVAMSMFALCACGKSTAPEEKGFDASTIDKMLQGKWESDPAIYIFKDGKFSCETVISGLSLGVKEGTYTIDEDSINILYDNGVSAELDYVFENNSLSITMSEGKELTKAN